MRLIDKFGNILLQGFSKVLGVRFDTPSKQAPWDSTETIYSGGKDPDANLEDFVKVYGNHTWAYAAISTIMQAGYGLDLVVYKKEGKSWSQVEETPLNYLFSKPNPYQDGHDLIEATLCYLETTGNCFWEVLKVPVRRKSGRKTVEKAMPLEIYVLKSQNIKIKPGQKKLYEGFVYNINGKEIFFSPDEIVHFKYFNPNCEWWGLSPIHASVAPLTMDFYSISYNKDFFKNRAVPDGVITTKDTMTTVAYQRLMRHWKKRHQGLGKTHKLEILEEGMDYKPLTLSPTDMQFIESRKLSREEILACFNVPPIKVGLLEYASYSNAREQNRVFWGECMLPKLRKIEEKFNQDIVIPYYGEDYWVEFDLQEVSSLKEDEDLRVQRYERLYRMQAMTINEVRQELGLSPLEYGNTIYVPMGVIPIEQVSALIDSSNQGGLENGNPAEGQQSAIPSPFADIGKKRIPRKLNKR